MEFNSVEELKTICRICLGQPEKSVSIWESQQIDQNTNTIQMAEMLMECASINVEKDGQLSEILCNDCVPVLISLYTFRQRCIKTNKYLDTVVQELDNIKMTEEETEMEYLEEIKDEYSDDDTKAEFLIDDNLTEECLSHICPKCNTSFQSQLILDGHYEFCSKSFECDICNVTFPELCKLEDHFYQHVAVTAYFDYKKEQELTCCACNETVQDDLKLHFELHSDFTCNVCKDVFNEPQLFKKHLQAHGLFQNICFECVLSYDSGKHRHRRPKHKTTFHCVLCDLKFPDCEDLKQHIKIHNSTELACPKCHEVFSNVISLQHHKKIHKFNYLCPTCGKTFENPNRLKSHIDTMHSKLREVCNICQKSYHSIYSLRIHQLRHKDEKPYACSFEGCSYRSVQGQDLKKHERIHTDERPYKCSYFGCEVAFRTASARMEHFRRHVGDKKHECDVCKMKFIESTHLRKHRLKHTNKSTTFSCDICDKSFSRRYSLQKHKDLVHFKREGKVKKKL